MVTRAWRSRLKLIDLIFSPPLSYFISASTFHSPKVCLRLAEAEVPRNVLPAH